MKRISIFIFSFILCISMVTISRADKSDLDSGAVYALSLLEQALGSGKNTTLGAAGIRIYLQGNGVDVDKNSLDIEMFSGNAVLYGKRDDDFWDAFIWSNIDESTLIKAQEVILDNYAEINKKTKAQFLLVVGFTGETKGYAIDSEEMAASIYAKYFGKESIETTKKPSKIDPAWTLVADLLSHYGDDLMLGEGNQGEATENQIIYGNENIDPAGLSTFVEFHVSDGYIVSFGKKQDGEWHVISWDNLSPSATLKNCLRVIDDFDALSSWADEKVVVQVEIDGTKYIIDSVEKAEAFEDLSAILEKAIIPEESIITNSDSFTAHSNDAKFLRDQIVKGSLFTLGHYEQDNNLNNGPEEIEWIVLENDGNKILLISEYGLDVRQFNDKHGTYRGTKYTWENCSLREWLNSVFLNQAFDKDEQSAIVTTFVDNNSEITEDKVFLLSKHEAYDLYFPSDKGAELCTPTAYAIANGAETKNGKSTWWLRSPGYSFQNAAIANNTKMAELRSGFFTSDDICVRPVICVDLNSDLFAWNQ